MNEMLGASSVSTSATSDNNLGVGRAETRQWNGLWWFSDNYLVSVACGIVSASRGERWDERTGSETWDVDERAWQVGRQLYRTIIDGNGTASNWRDLGVWSEGNDTPGRAPCVTNSDGWSGYDKGNWGGN